MTNPRIMNKKQLSKYPKKFILEFLQLYKSLPCLWKVKHEHYFDRAKKDQAYHLVIDKMLEVEEFPDRKMAISLFSALRCDYNKQLKRLEEWPDRKPTLWYFQHIDFLRNASRRPKNSLDSGLLKPSSVENRSITDDIEDPPDVTDNDDDNSQSVEFESSAVSIIATSTMSESLINSEEDFIDSQPEITEEQPTFQYFEELGTSWASILRRLPAQQNTIAQKLINDILYEAKMNKLNENTPTNIFNILQNE